MRLALEFLGYEISLRVGRSEPALRDEAPTHNDPPLGIFVETPGFLGVSDRFDPWETEDKR